MDASGYCNGNVVGMAMKKNQTASEAECKNCKQLKRELSEEKAARMRAQKYLDTRGSQALACQKAAREQKARADRANHELSEARAAVGRLRDALDEMLGARHDPDKMLSIHDKTLAKVEAKEDDGG